MAEQLWRRLYRTVTSQAVVVPLAAVNEVLLVSERVGNWTHGAYLGPLYEQMWVR